jgi:hypothetical protein
VLPLNPFLGEGIYAMAFLEGGKMYDDLTTLDAGQQPFDGTIAIVGRTALGPFRWAQALAQTTMANDDLELKPILP